MLTGRAERNYGEDPERFIKVLNQAVLESLYSKASYFVKCLYSSGHLVGLALTAGSFLIHTR